MGLVKIEGITDREGLLEAAHECSFYGIPVEELGREDLLLVIGFMSRQSARERDFHRKQSELMDAFRRVKNKAR